eukprot:TRINITY_DN4569_c0_g1_i1.p1 TRINITY_DN4569_c0_g1~~TRINITY_DN4569_c0_g1_i1.p1  ORF type:complete len:528 (+),score=87.99 TRINITY_DN4569_c0_g1_i1:59-1585(+)
MDSNRSSADYIALESQHFDKKPSTKSSFANFLQLLFIMLAVILIGGAIYGIGALMAAKTPAASVSGMITTDNMLQHLQNFSSIAAQYNNSRSVGLPSFNLSVEYVLKVIEDQTGWTSQVQYFTSPTYDRGPETFQLMSPINVNYGYGVDFENILTGVNGTFDLAGPISFVDNSGCSSEDYTHFIQGTIALMMRATNCTLDNQLATAIANNARAVLIFNDGTSSNRVGPFYAMATTPVNIMGLSLSESLGYTLKLLDNVQVRMTGAYELRYVTAANVIVDTPFGDDSSVVAVGAHLDSTIAGPGMNDDGSGCAFLLELAIQLKKSKKKTQNKIRFAWWGAAEYGMVGSNYYVGNLSSSELSDIALYLNADMLASSNYRIAVFDGSSAPAGCMNASIGIEHAIGVYLNFSGNSYVTEPFDQRSDYAAFLAANIPSGGIDAGAEQTKTMEEAKMFGGVAYEPYDPCYHQACDTIDNLNLHGYLIMAQALANTVEDLAQQKDLPQYLTKLGE